MVAALGGKVVSSRLAGGYVHLSELYVKAGDVVGKGDAIALLMGHSLQRLESPCAKG